MKSLIILSIIVALSISSCEAKDLLVGTVYNARLTWQQKAEYMGIPFKKRVKEAFYNDPAQQVIKGIVVRDIDHSDAIATITSGGVGSTYANIRMKSARGSGLNYQIEIYV